MGGRRMRLRPGVCLLVLACAVPAAALLGGDGPNPGISAVARKELAGFMAGNRDGKTLGESEAARECKRLLVAFKLGEAAGDVHELGGDARGGNDTVSSNDTLETQCNALMEYLHLARKSETLKAQIAASSAQAQGDEAAIVSAKEQQVEGASPEALDAKVEDAEKEEVKAEAEKEEVETKVRQGKISPEEGTAEEKAANKKIARGKVQKARALREKARQALKAEGKPIPARLAKGSLKKKVLEKMPDAALPKEQLEAKIEHEKENRKANARKGKKNRKADARKGK